jgi:hypothetical protein
MTPIRRTSRLVLLGLAIATMGCRDILQAEASNYAIINVETLSTGASTYGARPSALFFNAAGIFLSSSVVARDSCIVQRFPPDVSNPALDYLDPGSPVVARFARPQTSGTLTARTQGSVTSYVLPEGATIAFVPGDTITVEVPGIEDGFEERTIVARTAEAFVPSQLTIPASSQADMPVTWTPGATAIPGSAMFYSLRFSAPAASSINREIACFFIDDGNATVPFESLFDFREATLRDVRAQRIRVTANRIGTTVTHVTSTFNATVPVSVAP